MKDEKLNRAFLDSRNRIRTMALIHERLYQSRDFARVDFADYIRALIRDLYRSYGVKPENLSLKIDGKGVFLRINTAIPCGLILNELICNSLMHAFPEGRKGEIYVGLHADEDQLTLIVKDNGVGFPQDLDFRKTESLGLNLVVMMVEQIDATIELHREGGTEFRISLSLDKERAVGYLNQGTGAQ